MQLLLFSASTRTGSYNTKLIELTSKLMKTQADDIVLDVADFKEFDMPLYDADLNATSGLPKNALHFIERLQKADGLVISSPEYNFSIPGTLKNLIDWVSGQKPMPWKAKPILLMSAAMSVVGGNRGLWATRIPLEACGSYVFSDMFSLALAQEAFIENGELKDSGLQDRLNKNLADFIHYVRRLT